MRKEEVEKWKLDVNLGRTYKFKFKIGDRVRYFMKNLIVLDRYIENLNPRYTVYPPGKKGSVGAHFWIGEEDLESRT